MTNITDYLKLYLDAKSLNPLLTGTLKVHKLSLRPLADMTEKEAIELIVLQCHNGEDTIRIRYKDNEIIGWKYSIFNRHEKQSIRYECSTSFSSLNTNQFKYLIDNKFDIFNLIKLGHAVAITNEEPRDDISMQGLEKWANDMRLKYKYMHR